MYFDINRVYTAVNAEELKIGSKVIVANYLESLRNQVEANSYPVYIKELTHIMGTSSTNRFKADDNQTYNLAYLVSEPEDKKLKWTDLKIGDVIRNEAGTHTMMVTGIDSREEKGHKPNAHILISDTWLDDDDLAYWEKVEE